MSKLSRFIDKKILNPIRSTYLCIRYPFLYPRNRFTGKHYNNWKLHQYHVDNYNKCVGVVTVLFHNVNNFNSTEKLNLALNGYYYRILGGVINVFYNGKLIKRISIYNISESYSSIVNIGFTTCYGGTHLNVVFDDSTVLLRRFMLITNVIDKWLYFKIKVADFLNDYVLQILHCIPTYTELDALKYECYGWYKRFGKQLMNDMKKQLKKDKMLYSFRITQIKEKYGQLCIYCGTASREMYDLINKYSSMSEHICIECGEDADIITTPYGWQCPYCNNCYNKNHNGEAIQYKKEINGNWVEIDTGE